MFYMLKAIHNNNDADVDADAVRRHNSLLWRDLNFPMTSQHIELIQRRIELLRLEADLEINKSK